ncbi:uncharacterized protein, partial [Antedon mediterranea]|uniref:uncharacterized protein n=1 Tax=Antedon mediterranea TaxID=105859 RepID=UPI003AF6CDDC
TEYTGRKLQATNQYVINRATNAVIENWFGNVKKDYLGGNRQRLRPAHFIRKSYLNITGRVAEVHLKESKKRKVKGKTQEHVRRTKPGKYFSKPKNGLPQPKKRRSNNKNRMAQENVPQNTENASKLGSASQSECKTNRKNGKSNEPDTKSASSSKEDIENPEEIWKRRSKSQGNAFCSNDSHMSNNIPIWGGQVVYRGVHCFIQNTCTIDNLLLILSRLILNVPMLYKTIEDHGGDMCKLLQNIVNNYNQGQWSLAKVRWLCEVHNIQLTQRKRQNIDAFGSEYNFFVRHMSIFQENIQQSECSNPLCVKKIRNIRSPSIELGMPEDRRIATVQEALNYWIHPSVISPCGFALSSNSKVNQDSQMGRIALHQGPFHTAIRFLVYPGFGSAGLRDILIEARILAEGLVDRVLEGKQWERGFYAHSLTAEALVVFDLWHY